LAAALRSAFSTNGKECSFVQYASQGHGFNVTVGRDTIIAFFTRYLLSPVPATASGLAAGRTAPEIKARNSQVTFSAAEPFDVMVTDAQGREVLSQRCDMPRTIDLASTGPGIRLCTIRTRHERRTIALVNVQ
jgi:hypothetical protein